jgi:ribonuclease BN (tRNA processing enzyme)
MIFTHAHWDHMLGFPFFRPIYTKETLISMHGCKFAQQSVKDMISKTMRPPHFPVYYDNIQAEIKYQGACKCHFRIDTVNVTPVSLSHPNRANGYKFVEDDRSFVFMTDNELSYNHPGGLDFQDYVNFSARADLLVHDAEYTPDEYALTRSWGHSVYRDALKLALEARVKNFGLFHHNQDRTDNALDSLEHECKEIISDRRTDMKCFAVSDGMEYIL